MDRADAAVVDCEDALPGPSSLVSITVFFIYFPYYLSNFFRFFLFPPQTTVDRSLKHQGPRYQSIGKNMKDLKRTLYDADDDDDDDAEEDDNGDAVKLDVVRKKRTCENVVSTSFKKRIRTTKRIHDNNDTKYKSREFIEDSSSSDDDADDDRVKATVKPPVVLSSVAAPIMKVPPIARKTIKMIQSTDKHNDDVNSDSCTDEEIDNKTTNDACNFKSGDHDSVNNNDKDAGVNSDAESSSSSSSSSSGSSSSSSDSSSDSDSDDDTKIAKEVKSLETEKILIDVVAKGQQESTIVVESMTDPEIRLIDKPRPLQESTRHNVIRKDDDKTIGGFIQKWRIDDDYETEYDIVLKKQHDSDVDDTVDPDYELYNKDDGQAVKADDVGYKVTRRRSSKNPADLKTIPGEINEYMTSEQYLNVCYVTNEQTCEVDYSKFQVRPSDTSEAERRIKNTNYLKRVKLFKAFSDNNPQIRKYIDCRLSPTMCVSDYKNVVSSSEDNTPLYKILATIERNHNIKLKIVPSKLGEMLRKMSQYPDKLPQETLTVVNYETDLRHYKLMYGLVPARYCMSIEVLATSMIQARKNESYDLFEGEVELMSMALWRLTAQDLKFYNERVGRTSKKELLRYLYLRLVDTLQHVRAHEFSKFNAVDKSSFQSACRFLKALKRYALFNNKTKIQTMALVIAKELLMLVYMYVSPEEINLWSGLFLDLGVHHVLFSHTYNYLIRQRPNIFTWFGHMLNIYADTLNVKVLRSAWRHYSDKTKIDKDGNNLTVFTKKDVRVMFHKLFPKDKDVPLALLVKIDNFFMIFVHYFTHYLRTTSLVEQRTISLKHIICFLEIFNTRVWPRYGNDLLNVQVRNTIKKEFADCIKNERNRIMGNFDNDQFSLDPDVINTLLLLAFNVLSWVIGPIVVSPCSAASPQKYAALFIRAIDIFERDYLGTSPNFPFRYDFPTWIDNAHDDKTYEEGDDFNEYENGILMFPEIEVFDSSDDENDADNRRNLVRRLAGERRNVVDLCIPDDEVSDFNESDSECELYENSTNIDRKIVLMQKMTKICKKLKDIDLRINKGLINDTLVEEKMILQKQREELEDEQYRLSIRIEDNDFIYKIKSKRLECERMVINGECEETLFDLGIVPPDVERYLNRPMFERHVEQRPKRKFDDFESDDDDNFFDDEAETKSTPNGVKRLHVSDESYVVGSGGYKSGTKLNSGVVVKKKSNKVGVNYKLDFIKYLLNDDEDFKIMDGVKMFGLVSNKTFNRGGRSKVGCSLCNIPTSGSYSVKIDSSCAIGACMQCMNKIYKLLSSDKESSVTFEELQKFLKVRVDCRYKAPLLFDADGNRITVMLPKMSGPEDMYKYTYNKMDERYGKRIEVNKSFKALCDKYNWTGYAQKIKKRAPRRKAT
ncbi:MAG: hypothetical protein ACRYE7_02275 [Janthinobacterium lividum]